MTWFLPEISPEIILRHTHQPGLEEAGFLVPPTMTLSKNGIVIRTSNFRN